ncbi:heme peroxidase [Hypoxylon trugodes]|uniref:heme peroxidase n=1 Tax=Hypoxylon trugodes TaxID=326681 RepID=UPI00219F7858|nr:heme peroxidase [Hypoxylon trugodes]KAI1385388.1 heme peroxidase [Hypoxylon trugodes]
MRISSLAASFLGTVPTQVTAMFYYPNPSTSALEHILVDNWGAYASNFSSAITPCDNYVTEVGEPAINSHRTTSAQWIRVAFHDFATADVLKGTGGIDASIGFETARDENKGSAFNDSFTFWQPFVNEFVSMADLVAVGTVMSVHLCGGKYIPYQPGRIDAEAADPAVGVPEPGTSIEETLAQFKQTGFNQSDAIALTACGHTIGSTHSGGFPEVVEPNNTTPNNTNGGVDFDSSRAVFDQAVVHEYIDNTGARGGALVTSFNESSRSDLRLYESDGNKTMLELYAQGDTFQDTCVGVLQRMLHTVPSAVQLQPAITPALIKPINVTWDVTNGNQLVLSGRIRMLYAGEVSKDPVSITFSNGYTETLTPEEELGISAFKLAGSQINATSGYFPFSVSSASVSGASSFTVTAKGFEAQNFQIQDAAFVVPNLTRVADGAASITVAARTNRTDLDPSQLSIKITTPVLQPLTLAPKIVRTDVSLEKGESPLSDISYLTGSAAIGGDPTGAISVTLLSGEDVIDTLLLDVGVAGW